MQPSTVVRALALLYHWPTIVLLARAAWQWRAISALDALAFEVLLRLARLLAVAAHEGAHAAAAAWWMPQPSPPKLVLPKGGVDRLRLSGVLHRSSIKWRVARAGLGQTGSGPPNSHLSQESAPEARHLVQLRDLSAERADHPTFGRSYPELAESSRRW